MSALKVLLLAVDLATRRRDEAGKVLLRIRRAQDSAREQMGQLESYAADTESKWAVSAQVVASVEIVRHYYQFMDRLQLAIVLQCRVLADLDDEFLAAKKLLLEAEIRIAGLNHLLQKKQSGLRKLEAGREQKQLDEFAATQHRRLQAELDTTGAL